MISKPRKRQHEGMQIDEDVALPCDNKRNTNDMDAEQVEGTNLDGSSKSLPTLPLDRVRPADPVGISLFLQFSELLPPETVLPPLGSNSKQSITFLPQRKADMFRSSQGWVWSIRFFDLFGYTTLSMAALVNKGNRWNLYFITFWLLFLYYLKKEFC